MAWPSAAFAQDSAKVYRIFWVSTDSQPDPFLAGFREGLRARGYIEGKNVTFELHYAPGNPSRNPARNGSGWESVDTQKIR